MAQSTKVLLIQKNFYTKLSLVWSGGISNRFNQIWSILSVSRDTDINL